jgi:hypothetical protein
MAAVTPVRHRLAGAARSLAGFRGLFLVACVLFGVMVMHGGLAPISSVHAATTKVASEGAQMPEPKAVASDATSASMAGHHLPDVAGAAPALGTRQDHSGHAGPLCLAVLRSAVLLAGLLVALLILARRGHGPWPRSRATRRRGLPRSLPQPRAPSLAALCVLRL